jgi:murein DD-endopeptidase MepM/ murein hydrolase activator NlpD
VRSSTWRATVIGGIVLAAAAVCFALVPSPGEASTLSQKRQELDAARRQLGRLQGELDGLVNDYARAEARQYEIDQAVEVAAKDAARSEDDLVLMKSQLAARLVDLYKDNHGGATPAYLALLFEQREFAAVVERVDKLNRVAAQDDRTLNEIESHLAKVEALQADLDAKQAEQATKLAELEDSREALENRMNATAAEYRRLKKQVATLEEAERRALEAAKARAQAAVSGSAGSAAAARGFVFPVDGPHSYINDWGFSRSGGRSHKGTDIFAARGTPVVSVVGGRISRTAYGSGLGGTVIWLSGNNGASYYYAHLDGIAGGISGGTRVVAGQTIGYVGSTGNARGGSPHLHFEVHPGGGGAINPYSVLRASD